MSIEICVLCGKCVDTDFDVGLYKNGHFICIDCIEDIVNWFEED